MSRKEPLIDPELAKLCDDGNIERYGTNNINSFGESLSEAISVKAG